MNSSNLSGILTRDPVLRYSESGRPQTRLEIRCHSGFGKVDGKTVKTYTTLPVYVFGEKAERVAGWLREGYIVEVSAKLKAKGDMVVIEADWVEEVRHAG